MKCSGCRLSRRPGQVCVNHALTFVPDGTAIKVGNKEVWSDVCRGRVNPVSNGTVGLFTIETAGVTLSTTFARYEIHPNLLTRVFLAIEEGSPFSKFLLTRWIEIGKIRNDRAKLLNESRYVNADSLRGSLSNKM